MTNFILTTAPGSEAEATRELRKLNARLSRWLDAGVGYVTCSASWDETAALMHADQPIWIRHVHPVEMTAPIHNDGRDFLLFESLLPAALLTLDTERSFSVQVRLLGEGVQWQYSRHDISERLSAFIASWGVVADVRDPYQVLSVTCTPQNVYLGLSRAQDNLSSWAGGEQRFKRETDRISRAEFKLLEALDTFDIEIPAAGRGLDVGAAPGGWTRLLAERGLSVIAVDPAELDPRVTAHANVRHVKKLIQDVHFKEKFDVIVNDMRMDARDAARIMLDLADHLDPDGVAIMTLKLPEHRSGIVAESAMNILNRRYIIRRARQLFHNRSEITLVLGRKGSFAAL